MPFPQIKKMSTLFSECLFPEPYAKFFKCPHCFKTVNKQSFPLHARACRLEQPDPDLWKSCEFNECHEIQVVDSNLHYINCQDNPSWDGGKFFDSKDIVKGNTTAPKPTSLKPDEEEQK